MIRRISISAYAIGFVSMLLAVIVMYVQLRDSDANNAENHARSRADRAQLHRDQAATRDSVERAIVAGQEERREILRAVRRIEAKLDQQP